MNLSFGRSEVGNFRVNMFWQRGSIAIVVRLHPGQHPGDRLARSAARALGTDHGKARPDPDRRRDRLGQVDHHGVDARPSQRQPLRAHPDHRGPDRIPVPAQEIDGQPARDRHGHRQLGKCAEERHAPGAGLHPDRRNPRPRNHAGGTGLRADRPSVPGHAACQQRYHAINRIINFFADREPRRCCSSTFRSA